MQSIKEQAQDFIDPNSLGYDSDFENFVEYVQSGAWRKTPEKWARINEEYHLARIEAGIDPLVSKLLRNGDDFIHGVIDSPTFDKRDTDIIRKICDRNGLKNLTSSSS